jgi:hypothetical protein
MPWHDARKRTFSRGLLLRRLRIWRRDTSDPCELCRGITLGEKVQESSLLSIRERTASCNGCAVLLQALFPYVSVYFGSLEISTFETSAVRQPYVIRVSGHYTLRLDQHDVYITITAVKGTQHGPKNLEEMRRILTNPL